MAKDKNDVEIEIGKWAAHTHPLNGERTGLIFDAQIGEGATTCQIAFVSLERPASGSFFVTEAIGITGKRLFVHTQVADCLLADITIL
jgi:hypothetical protein